MDSFPPVDIRCIGVRHAEAFGRWLYEQGWIYYIDGSLVTVTGKYAGFALEITRVAETNGWATRNATETALNEFRRALDSGREK